MVLHVHTTNLPQDENALSVPKGAYGWEGIFTTKFLIDPKEQMVVTFFSQTLPCWRFNLKAELLPLVYRAIIDKSTGKMHPRNGQHGTTNETNSDTDGDV